MPYRSLKTGFLVILSLAGMIPWIALSSGPADLNDSDIPKTGGWRLETASSPYLKMHADNPVEWFPWGDEAFAKARAENKPLFISIGYFTCHWCHVMERESFRDPEIAALLNRHFVSIKVDREKRPDIDDAYMDYILATRGQGGWPMSVWAIPDGSPFFAGTYFPPETRYGRTGMRELLTRIADLWKTDAGKITKTSHRAVIELRQMAVRVVPLQVITDTQVKTARSEIAGVFDEFHGGFGHAPKFPQPARLLFLLQDDQPESVEMALHTLDRMDAGGIHDQLGGGFHRYSTDFEWHIPHFEKMLYDQALIARAYLGAFAVTGKKRYADVARSTLDFVLNQLRDDKGGFYSALNADSPVEEDDSRHMEEGAYYTWTWDQWTSALGDGELREWASSRYGVTRKGNATGEPTGELAGKNTLYRAKSARELMDEFGYEGEEANRLNEEADRRLLTARSQRPPVPVDDKMVAAWNGFMITALAEAAILLDEPGYQQRAVDAANFVLTSLYEEEGGILFRDWYRGARGVPGFAVDYAAMAQAFLALYAASGEEKWLLLARRIMARQIAEFWDGKNGGFFGSSRDTGLWVRTKSAVDGATVSANGMSIETLLSLAEFSKDDSLREKAWRAAAWAGGQLRDNPSAMPYILINWPRLLGRVEDGEIATGDAVTE